MPDQRISVPASLDLGATIAAPLLAGFSFTLVGVVLQLHPGDTRWPDVTVTLLIAAGISLIGAIQASLWSKAREGTARQVPWVIATRATYDLGIILLLAGVTTLLVPQADPSSARLAAILLAVAGFLAELVWAIVSVVNHPAATTMHAEQSWIRSIDSTQDNAAMSRTLGALLQLGYTPETALALSISLGHPLRYEDVPTQLPVSGVRR